MKKKLTSLILLLMTVNTIIAQQLSSFQIDDIRHALVEQFKQNTQLELYSTAQGGKKVQTISLNNPTVTELIFEANYFPAFVLNRKTISNPTGDNGVLHFSSNEFWVKEIKMNTTKGETNISWLAIIDRKEDISFEIWEGHEGTNYSRIAQLKASKSEDFIPYEFTQKYSPTKTYQLRVMKGDKQLRYQTDLQTDLTKLAMINVYPALLSDNRLYIDLKEEGEASFALYAGNGTLVQNNNLGSQFNMIQIPDLSCGTYFLVVKQFGLAKSFTLFKK